MAQREQHGNKGDKKKAKVSPKEKRKLKQKKSY